MLQDISQRIGRSLSVPDLTHQQFLVLEKLLRGKQSGRELRDALGLEGVRKSGPAFYQFMARMEDARWLKGWYEQRTSGGYLVKERWYEILGNGEEAYRATLAFYSDRLGGLASA